MEGLMIGETTGIVVNNPGGGVIAMPTVRFTGRPRPKWRLVVLPGRSPDPAVFKFDMVNRPNAWVRFWHWTLLGWRWESLEGER